MIGDETPSLYTTKSLNASAGTNNIYSFGTATWSSAHIDYNISSGSNYRAGCMVAVFTDSTVEFSEYSTIDVGNTTTGINAVTFSFTNSGGNSIFQIITSTNYNIKAIIRAI